MRTSVDAGHSHTFKPGDKRTGSTDGHRHDMPKVGVYTSKARDGHRHEIEYKKQRKLGSS